jgi:hypothetical protein
LAELELEAVAIVEEVFVELEQGASCRLLEEGKCSRVTRLVGRCRNRSSLLVAFAGIVGGLAGDLGVLGLVWGEEVVVCCIVGRGLAVVLGCAVEGQKSRSKEEWGCFSGLKSQI